MNGPPAWLGRVAQLLLLWLAGPPLWSTSARQPFPNPKHHRPPFNPNTELLHSYVVGPSSPRFFCLNGLAKGHGERKKGKGKTASQKNPHPEYQSDCVPTPEKVTDANIESHKEGNNQKAVLLASLTSWQSAILLVCGCVVVGGGVVVSSVLRGTYAHLLLCLHLGGEIRRLILHHAAICRHGGCCQQGLCPLTLTASSQSQLDLNPCLPILSLAPVLSPVPVPALGRTPFLRHSGTWGPSSS